MSGTNKHRSALITGFDAVPAEFTFTPALADGVTTENYVIIPIGRANIDAINNSAATAVRLALSAGQIIPFTVDDSIFSPTTVSFECADITEGTATHYNTRGVLFTSGALAGQVSRISGYTLEGGKGRFVVTTMTEAPADTDTGIII